MQLVPLRPGPERLAAAVAMHARLTDPDDIHLLFDSPREYWRLRESLGSHVQFRAVNPTGWGAYQSNPVDTHSLKAPD
jgi:hypothetical protein